MTDDIQDDSWFQDSVAHWEHMRIQCPWLPERSDGWHQHPNGGGWVQDTALAEPSAYVGPDALVFGSAQVRENARVCDSAHVYGHASLRDAAQAYGHARIRNSARLYAMSRIYDRAQITGNAIITGDTHVCGSVTISNRVRLVSGTWKTEPLYIQGVFPLPIYTAGIEAIALGSECHSLDEWEEFGADIAAKYGVDPGELLNTWLPVFRTWFRKHPIKED